MNSKLKASEYGTPVLGLIILRCADSRFEEARARIETKASKRRKITASDSQAERVLYVPDEAHPGRYVGTEVEDLDDEEFAEKLAAAHIELRELAARAATLEAGVDHGLQQLLER